MYIFRIVHQILPMNYSDNIHRLILFFRTSVDVGYLILFMYSKLKTVRLGGQPFFHKCSHHKKDQF